ncbi:hypothetical protein SAMN02910384_03194 [Pseudobutyrivibrio sp. ACV-2]|uniref:hypothetical protein n=1 Tax=Pseudobutyrivibrio sp. ACV-2 TaxID=1520801 RepID=UPI000897E842|nr:hypothetical protein [Pseudobutyrivibrio sp. ACV-2]SEB04457.1 hypothetical protein SAMN02910384_03194 [Pseudobutyrivibrio sp. ACV-2]
MAKADEDIIYDQLIKLGISVKGTKAKGKLKSDTESIQYLGGRVDSEIYYLEEATNLSQSELNKYICRAKNDFMLFNAINKRHPDLIKPNLLRRIDRLIHAIAKQEAILLQKYRIQNPNGNRINIEKLFDGNNYYKKLLNCNMSQLVKEILADSTYTTVGKNRRDIFITETGKKYHRKDCPYCKRKILTVSSMKLVRNLKLEPCKCIKDMDERTKKEDSYRTIFVDESLHNVNWNLVDFGSKVSSFSYIICKGNLTSETEITEDNIIAIDVEYTPEQYRIERVTKSAIAATMLMLAFDYGFKGHIKIFTDNQSTMKSWMTENKNKRLSELFESVTVEYIPREDNTKADQLGRTQMCLKLPMPVYKQIGDIITEFPKLKQDNERLKERELEDFLDREREYSQKLAHENNYLRNMSMISIIKERIKYLFQKEHLPVMAVDELKTAKNIQLHVE